MAISIAVPTTAVTAIADFKGMAVNRAHVLADKAKVIISDVFVVWFSTDKGVADNPTLVAAVKLGNRTLAWYPSATYKDYTANIANNTPCEVVGDVNVSAHNGNLSQFDFYEWIGALLACKGQEMTAHKIAHQYVDDKGHTQNTHHNGWTCPALAAQTSAAAQAVAATLPLDNVADTDAKVARISRILGIKLSVPAQQ